MRRVFPVDGGIGFRRREDCQSDRQASAIGTSSAFAAHNAVDSSGARAPDHEMSGKGSQKSPAIGARDGRSAKLGADGPVGRAASERVVESESSRKLRE